MFAQLEVPELACDLPGFGFSFNGSFWRPAWEDRAEEIASIGKGSSAAGRRGAGALEFAVGWGSGRTHMPEDGGRAMFS